DRSAFTIPSSDSVCPLRPPVAVAVAVNSGLIVSMFVTPGCELYRPRRSDPVIVALHPGAKAPGGKSTPPGQQVPGPRRSLDEKDRIIIPSGPPAQSLLSGAYERTGTGQ